MAVVLQSPRSCVGRAWPALLVHAIDGSARTRRDRRIGNMPPFIGRRNAVLASQAILNGNASTTPTAPENNSLLSVLDHYGLTSNDFNTDAALREVKRTAVNIDGCSGSSKSSSPDRPAPCVISQTRLSPDWIFAARLRQRRLIWHPFTMSLSAAITACRALRSVPIYRQDFT